MALGSMQPVPPGNLWKRFSTNFLSYGYSQVVTLAVQFLSVPFFLHYWGKEKYAEWLVLSGIPITLGLLDFGVAQASATKATTLSAQDEKDGVMRCLHTALAFSLVVCGGILFVGMLAAATIDWRSLLKLHNISNNQAALIIMWLLGHLCMNLLSGPLNAWFMAMDRTSTGFFILANRRLLDVIITVVLLPLGCDAPVLATAMFIGQLLFLMAAVQYALRISPWRMWGIKEASLQEFRTIAKPAIGFAGMSIAQTVTLQSGLQLLNQIAPASVVVIYSMSRTLMRLVLQIGQVSSLALRPVIARSIGVGQSTHATKIVQKITLATTLIASATYLILVMTGPSIIKIWGAGKTLVTHSNLAWIGAHALLNVIWLVPATIRFASNNHAKIAGFYGMGTITSLLVWPLHYGEIDPLLLAALALLIPEFFAAIALLATKAQKNRSIP